jgi:hypothetical protein
MEEGWDILFYSTSRALVGPTLLLCDLQLNMKLTIHLHLVLRRRTHGTLSPMSLYTFMS